MIKERNAYDILNSLAITFILCNAVLYLDPIPILRWGFSGLRAIAVVYAFLVAFPQLRFGKFTILVGIFYGIVGIITFMHGGSFHAWLANTINSVGLILLVYLSILRSSTHTTLLLSRLFNFFIYTNFFLTILFPDGPLDGAYLLGANRNQVGPPLICGLVLHYYAYHMHERNWFTFALLAAVCIATPILVGSMTSAVGCALLTTFFFIPTRKLRKIALITFFIFYLVFQSFIVFFHKELSENTNASFFIEEILKKDLTFTNRVYVWDEAYKQIAHSPITGYGMQDSDWFENVFFVKSAHNIIYQVLIYGGVILLAIFFIIVATSAIRAIRNKSELTLYALFGTCALFFMMIMEAYNLALVFLLLELTYYSSELSQNKIDNK